MSPLHVAEFLVVWTFGPVPLALKICRRLKDPHPSWSHSFAGIG
jgi:hypothetical protein